MPVTLDATVGGEDANTYVLLADAQTFFDARLHSSAWDDAADDDTRNRALVTAARLLDQFDYVGTQADPDTPQALAWPREGYDLTGAELDSDAIPQAVVDAQCVVALALLASGTTDPLAVATLSGLKSVQSGDDRVEFRDTPTGGAGTTLGAGYLPPEAARLLRHLLVGGPASVRRVA